MKVRVVAHDPAWQSAFDAEAKLILHALGSMAIAIHHIGSTPIPGIVAKPIIDILLVADHLARLDEKSSEVVRLGYQAKGEFGIPGRRYFRKDNASGIRTHQIHAFQAGHSAVARHLVFRDFMIAHPVEAQTYSALKQRLALAHPDDLEAYMDGKDAFIKEYEAKAAIWLSVR